VATGGIGTPAEDTISWGCERDMTAM